MTIIIGIDPGSRFTGYGVIQIERNKQIHVTHGCLQLTEKNVALRLQKISKGIADIIQQFHPEEAAIEQVFLHKNASSALKLGQARGAAMVGLDLPVAEYSARQVKQAIVGFGAATKEQVQHMVKRLLNLSERLQPDAADALAIALCHSFSRNKLNCIEKKRSRQSGRKKWTSFLMQGLVV